MKPNFTNRLSSESSVYLLQHAHNPVDWYPWGAEALQKARDEDKPIIVSIGYAACHWCHVMEKESFEDEVVAVFMNEHFINIKVDREERPDLDHIFMDAVQAIAGSGGWPLNVFLLPDGKPFFGGTYFPPRRAFNRASWMEVLQAIATTYKEGRDKLFKDAETLTEHLRQSNQFGSGGAGDGSRVFEPKRMDEAFKKILKVADREWGGFGKAPKFPQTFTISFLLGYAHRTGNEDAREHALLSLDKMLQGGIYDHLGGGFARYSTDREWLAPHFEKMLYDNAQLVTILSEAYALTGRETYREVIEETLSFVERELMDGKGGFYSALDADSEGEEGKYYVWSHEEVTAALGEDAPLFCAYYDISPEGNWEGKNILRVLSPMALFAAERAITEEALLMVLQRGREKLFRLREGRVRPGLDDKVLLGWNALMNAAYSRAAAALGRDDYRQTAERNMAFLLKAFAGEEGWLHTWKGGKAKYPAFLDDLAYLVDALIRLSEVTGNDRWLQEAQKITEVILDGFSDEADTLFYFTHREQEDILLRKKEIQDGATPSGNSAMAGNLYRLGILFDREDWRGRAERMLLTLGEAAIRYPTSFAVWLTVLSEVAGGTSELAIVGPEAFSLLRDVNMLFIPHKLVMAAIEANDYPLLRGKGEEGKTRIYLCRNYACQKPVSTVEELSALVNPK